MATNQNVLQLTQQTGSAVLSSVFYAVTAGTNDTGLPLSVLVNNLGLTGVSTVPTATAGTNTIQIASCAFVQAAVSGGTYAGSFTTLAASGAVSGTGFTNYFAAPPAIGSTTASSGAFTTLSASGAVSGTGFTNYMASPPAIGGTAAAAGSFTNLSATGTVSGAGFTNYMASPPAIGGTTASSAKFTTITATSTITPSTTSGIVGTTLADSANAGSVGEILSATVSTATSVTSATPLNLVTLSLTAGDWDVTGGAAFTAAATTTISALGVSCGTASGSLGGYNTGGILWNLPFTTGSANVIQTGVTRVNVSTTTNVYLVVDAFFAVSTMTAQGFIRARRVR